MKTPDSRPAEPPRPRGSHAPPGARWELTGDEWTLVGLERASELKTEALLALCEEARIFWIRRRAMVGLPVLLAYVLVLAGAAIAGVACHWFSDSFALGLLGLTVTPCVGAWVIVLRGAFARESDRD